MSDRLSWADRKAIALDQAEYFVRRLGCRLFGHKDQDEYEASELICEEQMRCRG